MARAFRVVEYLMKKLLMLVGFVLVLMVVAFFVVTSSGFLRSVVLPKVGAALNAKVDAESISLSPMSSLEVRKLSVVPNGAEPLATVDLVRVRYGLLAILRGTITVEEVLVSGPTVTVVNKADGTSNLDPILKKLAEGGTASAPAPAPSGGKPAQVDLKSLKIENGTVRYRTSGAEGALMDAEVSGLNLTLRDVKNGGTGRLEVGANLKLEQRPGGSAATATVSGVQGTVKGGFDLALTPELLPGAVGGKLEAQLAQATGAFKDFQGFAAALSADLVPGELKRLGLDFSRQGTPLGSVSASGPLDATKMEAKLQVDLSAIDRNVLNLFGSTAGLDFTTTRFDSANRIEVTAGGKKVAINGALTGSKIAVKQGNLTTPELDLKETYDVTVDLGGQVATVSAFSLSGVQGGREILKGSLANPMQVSWAPNSGALPDAAVNLEVANLLLADWSALVGTPLSGTVQARIKAGVQGGGKDLAFDVTAGAEGISGTFGSNQVRQLGMGITMRGVLTAFADAPRRKLKLETGIDRLSGEAAMIKFVAYSVSGTAEIGLPEGAVVIDAASLQLKEGTQPGGIVDVKGRWDLKRGAGDITLNARDLNEHGLRPFLQVGLGDKELKTVKLAAGVVLKLDPAADTSVAANVELKDLVVRDPSGAIPESPLALGLALEALGAKQKLTVKKAELRLSPTERAKNVAGLTGELDYSKTNALRGGFKLSAESLDVTPFVDLFAGGSKPGAAPAPAPTPAPTGPQKEPDAIQLPIELLTFDATIGKFFLREIAAENFVAGVKIAGSRIEIQPLQLALNGAPIKAAAKLNLGVPGYEYDLTASAEKIPVRPIANSFVPMLKDRIEGAMVAGLEVKGAGVTGVNLQKHLTGGMRFSVTNANLSLDPKAGQKSGFLTLLATVLANALNIRELKEQPIMDVMANVRMGAGRIEVSEFRARSASFEAGSTGGIPIAADLMQSPLNFPVNLALHRDVSDRARLTPSGTPTNLVYVPLPAIATMKGTLGAPAPEIDKVQVGLLLARGVGGLLGGRAGDAAGGVADLVTGVAKGGTNAVGNLLQGIGGLLGGRKAATDNTPAPNAPAPAPTATVPSAPTAPATAPAPPANSPTNAVNNLIRGIGGLLGGRRSATNSPAPKP